MNIKKGLLVSVTALALLVSGTGYADEVRKCGDEEYNISDLKEIPRKGKLAKVEYENGIIEYVRFYENQFNTTIYVQDAKSKSHDVLIVDGGLGIKDEQIDFLEINDPGISYRCKKSPLVDKCDYSCIAKMGDKLENLNCEESLKMMKYYQKEFDKYRCILGVY